MRPDQGNAHPSNQRLHPFSPGQVGGFEVEALKRVSISQRRAYRAGACWGSASVRSRYSPFRNRWVAPTAEPVWAGLPQMPEQLLDGSAVALVGDPAPRFDAQGVGHFLPAQGRCRQTPDPRTGTGCALWVRK